MFFQYMLTLVAATVVASSSTAADASTSSINLPTKSDLSNALYQYLSTPSTSDASRKLETFDTLNEIFSEISLDLPDATVSKSGLDVSITELVCRDLNVGDIQIDHEIQSNTAQKVGVDITGIKIMCNFRYAYSFTIFSGAGVGNAFLDRTSNASIDFVFKSDDYTKFPPTDVNVADCRTDIQIADMNFDGDGAGIISGILDLFEGLLRDTVEGELNQVACNELSALGNDALDDLLLVVSTQLDAYAEPEASEANHPLSLEDKLELHIDDAPLYLDFQALKNGTGLIKSAWDKLDELFTTSNATEGLSFNNIMRDYVLDDDGLLEIDPSILSNADSFFNAHDMLTETSMSIKSIKIGGLDTFTKMDVLRPIGKHTMQNSIHLDFLDVVVEMEALMKASSKDDAVIVAENSPPIKESFTIDFKVTDVEVDFSFFLGLSLEDLGNLQLGSILDMSSIFPCLLNAIDIVSVTELAVNVSDMEAPTLVGFLDKGVDYLITKMADVLFHMYENVLILRMPNFFGSFVRPRLNDFLADYGGSSTCPTPDPALNSIVDFRDLMLPAKRSVELLGSGESQYGSLFSMIYGILEKLMAASDENGLSKPTVLSHP